MRTSQAPPSATKASSRSPSTTRSSVRATATLRMRFDALRRWAECRWHRVAMIGAASTIRGTSPLDAPTIPQSGEAGALSTTRPHVEVRARLAVPTGSPRHRDPHSLDVARPGRTTWDEHRFETVDENSAAERPNAADLVRGRAALVVVPAVTVTNANRQVFGFVRPPA